MAKSDSPAVGIHARSVKLRLLDHGQRLRGKGFVEFDDSHVVQRKARELQRFGNGLHRADAEFLRQNASRGVRDETRERFEAENLGPRVAHDDGSRRAVAHWRTVARGDRAFRMKRWL